MRTALVILLGSGFILATGAGVSAQAQYPGMERVAEKVIQKYEHASCQELASERGHRPSGEKAEMEERAVRLLHEDPEMRRAFLDRVAAPIANKLFECGMIP
jgi:hypothetical protein